MYKKPVLALFLFFIISAAVLLSAENDKKTEKNITVREERIETIKYGIDAEVINLVTDLKKENNTDFNDELLKLVKTTRNNTLKETVIGFFKDQKNPQAVNFAFDQIQNNYLLSNESIIKYISYISDYQNSGITDYLVTLFNHENEPLADAAIDAVGKSGESAYGKKLLELLKDSDISDSKKIHVIGALGKLKYKEAGEEIEKYLEKDYTDNRSLRWKACVALGELGDENSLPIIINLFSDNDPYLRKYAIESLGYFPPEKTEDIVIEGLRDSSWRVRISAAQSLGHMKSKKAVPILIYKAKKDPDIKNVRNASIKALSEIGTSDSLKFLREMLSDDKTNIQNRTTALAALIETDLGGSLKYISELIDTEWGKPSSYLLDYTCKLLSQEKNRKLKDLYVKMLTYTKTANLKIYALRGIKLNKMISLKETVQKLAEDDKDKRIQNLASDVLDSL